MKCPSCKGIELIQVMAHNGVMVDYCPQCDGVWLDKGEIYYFTKTPLALRDMIDAAIKNPKPSARLDPRTGEAMVELWLLNGKLVIDYCPSTEGIWLDKGELDGLPDAGDVKLNFKLDKNVLRPDVAPDKRPQVVLPNLAIASGTTLFILYGFLSLILIALVNFQVLTAGFAFLIGLAVAGIQFGLGPFIMDLTLRFAYHVQWQAVENLPSHLQTFLKEACVKSRIKIPRIGIITDGAPNAFTYGHTPNNARVVITSGLMNLLDEDEIETVVAHEIGHAVHWDMLVMTVANLVPLILYYVFRTLIRMKSDREDKSAPYRYLIALVAYILYIVSEYIVLWFSRIREYFADRFAGELTGNPNGLASALVKIGYGLAGRANPAGKDDRQPQMEAVKAMGIFDPLSARSLAVAGYRPGMVSHSVDKENLQGVMRWDIWNPWAMYYELHSTHPLIAKRLLALSRQAESLGGQPYIRFDERKPESYWDEFFVDLAVQMMPLAVIIAGIILYILRPEMLVIKFGLIIFGSALAGQAFLVYPRQYFPEMNIASLLKQVKVSAVRPVPCAVKGKIIGRGVPGLVWSEDFVMQDASGIMFLDYRQPLGLWNFFFGLLKAGRFQGQNVTVTGWYRRAPVPYLEIMTLKTAEDTVNCYTYIAKIIFGIVLAIAGAAWFFL